jgi:hypothetical protein
MIIPDGDLTKTGAKRFDFRSVGRDSKSQCHPGTGGTGSEKVLRGVGSIHRGIIEYNAPMWQQEELQIIFISLQQLGASGHSSDTRECVIGQVRSYLVPVEQNRVPAVQMQSYSNLLNRAPTRFSLATRINGVSALQDKG